MTELWTRWEGQVINGVFPLRRFLSASDHSAVFLTEYKAENLPSAALKLVPAIPALAQTQLSHWTAAIALTHPHLIRLLDAGRCQLGGLQYLFVVMEYAEQTLSQILSQRALTPGELRETLIPTLSALAFLHSKNLVHGQLKPSNILAVNDQLKLASDTVRPAGESTANSAKSSTYDPPETKGHSVSAAGDIWGLGITMVEALTQHLPSWPDRSSETASFPAVLPPTFAALVRRCLSLNPASRPTADDVKAQINPAPQRPVDSVPEIPLSAPKPLVSKPQPLVRKVPDRASAPSNSPPPSKSPPPAKSLKQRLFLPAIAVLSIVILGVWVGLRGLNSQASLQRAVPPIAGSQNPETPLSAPPGVSAPSSGAKPADSNSTPSRVVSRPSDQPAQPLANRLPSVLHEEIPDVPRRNRQTIRGHIKVWVRVTVDSSGKVVGETVERPGPSAYFARLATEAARKWKFVPAGNHDSRKWLLQFEFTRSGASGHATTPRP
jgi:TonB family protein